MCGIGGILRVHRPGAGIPPHFASIPDAWLDILDAAIRHRGPDGAGRFRDRARRQDGTVIDVALLHRRLSIIDHAGGFQPMVHIRHADGSGRLLRPDSDRPDHPRPAANVSDASEWRSLARSAVPGRGPDDGTPPTIDASGLAPETDLIAVVFNGCIYNHIELRAELVSLGHRFETDHSDTEVLVHGWRQWGPDLRHRLDAMHAHLAWIRSRGLLVSGTDRAGEKPLYAARNRESTLFAWSSTPAGLVRLSGIAGLDCHELRPDTLAAWIVHGAVREPPVRCVAAMPRFWGTWPTDPTRPACRGPAPPRRGSSDQAEPFRSPDDVIHTLEQSVRKRLDADVPMGVFLSGGIDSGLIAAIAARLTDGGMKAYTVRMPDPSFDESPAASQVARHLGIRHRVLDCPAAPAEDLVRLIEQLGLPFGDSSLLPSYWVARAASEEIKVALGGDGGDELFGGYRRYQVAPLLHRLRPLARFIPTLALPQRHPRSATTELARLLDAARASGYPDLLRIFPPGQARRLLDGRPDAAMHARDRPDASGPSSDPLRWDFEHYLPDDILRKSDTASMAAPLELRSPFLAGNMIDRALATPLCVLMPNNERKGLLRQAARRLLPPEIVDRPKQGFAIPIGAWFRNDFGGMRQLLRDHLESSDPFPGLAEAGIEVRTDVVRRMMREHDAAGGSSPNPWRGRDHSQRLYVLLVLSIWAKWRRRVGRYTLTNSEDAR